MNTFLGIKINAFSKSQKGDKQLFEKGMIFYKRNNKQLEITTLEKFEFRNKNSILYVPSGFLKFTSLGITRNIKFVELYLVLRKDAVEAALVLKTMKD